MSIGEQKTCYWIFNMDARTYRTAEAMYQTTYYLTGDGTIDVIAKDINEENRCELKLVGRCENLDAGLKSMQQVFLYDWRADMRSGVLYYVAPDDGHYGTIKALRVKDSDVKPSYELTLENIRKGLFFFGVVFQLTSKYSISVSDVYMHFYEYRCDQLSECINGAFPKELVKLILKFTFTNEKECFVAAKEEECVELCLSYAEKNDKEEFTKEHASALSFGAVSSFLKKNLCKLGKSASDHKRILNI